jgi:hypothetical protein
MKERMSINFLDRMLIMSKALPDAINSKAE